jgi:hypothetical protein
MTTIFWMVIGLVCLYLVVRGGLAWLLRRPRAK